jgi:putative DNA primase/helicase
MGLTATCNPCGAGNWRPEFNQHFAGRDVIILPDNDGPGLAQAEDVARSLYPVAKSVRVVWLSGVPQKGDVSDWLDAGHTIADLEEISALTPLWSFAESEGANKSEPPCAAAPEQKRSVVLRCFADIAPEPLTWLWPGRIPRGKLTLLIGDPGQGKSLLTVDIASRVTREAAFPDGAACESGEVIVLSAEDDPADTIRPRLDAAGADVSRAHILEAVRVRLDDGELAEKSFNLETDLAVLEETLRKNPGVRLIVIDPISAYLGGVDSHRDAEVRGLLAPLTSLAGRYHVAIVGVAHLPKSRQRAVHSVIGSIGFAAAARAVWAVATDMDDPERRLMLPVKQNLAANTGGLAFRVEAPNGVPRILWEKGVVSVDVNDVLGGFEDREKRSARREAADWLREQLTDGPLPVKKLQVEAKAAGFDSWHTVRDAAQSLGVKKVKGGFKSGWQWSLPNDPACEDAVADTYTNVNFDAVHETRRDSGTADREEAVVRENGTFGETNTPAAANGLVCSRCGNREQNLTAARFHYNKLCPMLRP